MRNAVRWIIIVAISFCFLGAAPKVAVAADHVLSVHIYTWEDETPGDPFDTEPDPVGLYFPGVGDLTTTNPWIVSPQYLWVTYDSPESSWGIRIVTDNQANIEGVVTPRLLGIRSGPDEIPGTADDTWEAGPDGVFGTGDDIWGTGPDGVHGTDDDTVDVSYAGMIDPATKNNPNFRTQIAWQVYADAVPEPNAIAKHFIYGWNVGSNPIIDPIFGGWIYPYEWAYMVDKSNWWDGEPSVGGIFYPPPAPLWSVRYEIVVQGSTWYDDEGIEHGLNFLAQYPPMQLSNPDIRPGDPKPGECTIAIYLANCFGVPSNEVEGDFVGLMPAGNYGAKIYLELIHE